MGFKESIEKNVVVWLLGILVTGFVTGVGAYKGILDISGSTTILKERRMELERKVDELDHERKNIQELQSTNKQLTDKLLVLGLSDEKDVLTFTHWEYHDTMQAGALGLVFLPNGGLLVYGSPRSALPADQKANSWARHGSKVILKINNGFSVYDGELVGDLSLSGSANSRTGKSWKWTATRLPN